VKDVEELQALAARNLGKDKRDSNRLYSNLAPLVSRAAQVGSPIAQRACDAVADEITYAILLVASSFTSPRIPVVLSGGVLRSDYVRSKVTLDLASSPKKELHVGRPSLSPISGAVLLAQRELEIPKTQSIVDNLISLQCLY